LKFEIMLKKLVVLGLVILLAGAAMLGRVLLEKREEQKQAPSCKFKHGPKLNDDLEQYREWLELPPEERPPLPFVLDESGKAKTEAQLLQEQQERLKADLDKLAAGETDVLPFADVIYGENWQKEIDQYKRQKELREFVFNASIVCTSIGGTIFTSCLLLYVLRLVIAVLTRLRQSLANAFGARTQGDDNDLTEIEAVGGGRNPHSAQNQVSPIEKASEQQKSDSRRGQHKKRPDVSMSTGLRRLGDSSARRDKPVGAQAVSGKSESGVNGLARNGSQTAALVADEESTESTGTAKAGARGLKRSRIGLAKAASKAALSYSQSSSADFEDSLETQIADLKRQVDSIKQIAGDAGLQASTESKRAQGIKQATAEAPDTLHGTLTELTQQVAAIREYASSQQDRVKKLQEGYDWNIIRNFCMRFIRCIDNLESRMNGGSEGDVETAHLKEVRDELLFALESSGVEQFELEENSDYRGQEKYAEAVKEREHSDDPDLTGKIAKLIRPGYQYFVDEENIKVVRPAMVKLFG
jgi:molecular chaperone GrpE (heat shock protein)